MSRPTGRRWNEEALTQAAVKEEAGCFQYYAGACKLGSPSNFQHMTCILAAEFDRALALMQIRGLIPVEAAMGPRSAYATAVTQPTTARGRGRGRGRQMRAGSRSDKTTMKDSRDEFPLLS